MTTEEKTIDKTQAEIEAAAAKAKAAADMDKILESVESEAAKELPEEFTVVLMADRRREAMVQYKKLMSDRDGLEDWINRNELILGAEKVKQSQKQLDGIAQQMSQLATGIAVIDQQCKGAKDQMNQMLTADNGALISIFHIIQKDQEAKYNSKR